MEKLFALAVRILRRLKASLESAITLIFYLCSVSANQADIVKTHDGHVFRGEIKEQSDWGVSIIPEKCYIRKNKIRRLVDSVGVETGGEFFGKLELRDDSKILGWIQRLPEGDIAVKRHSVFGENYRISKNDILLLSAIGKTVVHLENAIVITGFISGENEQQLLIEMREPQILRIDAKNLAKGSVPKPEGLKKNMPDLRGSKFILGLVSGAYLPFGTFKQYLKHGYSGGLDYLQSWPSFLQFLGHWIVSTRIQLYEGNSLKIFYGQLYAGINRYFPLHKSHALYGMITGGINYEQIRESKFLTTNLVAGAALHVGYSYSWSGLSLRFGGVFQYYYDASYPLLGFGGELGVFYAL